MGRAFHIVSHSAFSRIFTAFAVSILLGGFLAPSASHAQSASGAIIVNGIALTAETVNALQRLYPVAIAPGRYWYDGFSGAYGVEGGPVAGQMLPGLGLGGPLRADASRGTSGVFINGRQLTFGETAHIAQACSTPVVPGRYWVNAQGLGGYEGGPAAFNLALCGNGGGGRSNGGSSTRTYCDANGACTSSGILGSILTTP
jgi:hypothetical protein